MENILDIKDRFSFRDWLKNNHQKEKECYLILKRGRPKENESFWYVDAIEEALCFGWIDSTCRKIDDVVYQRFGPRKKNSHWTELNKERARRLIKLGLMQEAGYKSLPDMNIRHFKIDEDIIEAFKRNRIWRKFKNLNPLCQRVKISNLIFYKNNDNYQKKLDKLILDIKNDKIINDWNDFGRLLNY